MSIKPECKVPVIIANFNETPLFSADFRKNQIQNFINIGSDVAELYHSDRQGDKANSRLSEFCGSS
jgi:hypothetical protein